MDRLSLGAVKLVAVFEIRRLKLRPLAQQMLKVEPERLFTELVPVLVKEGFEGGSDFGEVLLVGQLSDGAHRLTLGLRPRSPGPQARRVVSHDGGHGF